MPIHDHVLTLSCPDRPGIVTAVSGAISARGGNILEAHPFNDAETGIFFLRTVFALSDCVAPEAFARGWSRSRRRMRWTGSSGRRTGGCR